MGLLKFYVTCLALLIFAVVKTDADCNNDLMNCATQIAAITSAIGEGQTPTAEMIQPFCPNIANFQTCLNSVPENCKNDPSYGNYQQSAAGYSVFCSGTGGSTCAVMECVQMMMPGSNAGAGDPNAEPEPKDGMEMIMNLCGKYETFKTCVATKSQNCPQQVMDGIKNTTDSYKMTCEGDCATYKVTTCVKNMDLTAFQNIKGFPTKDVIQPLCSRAEPAMKCLGDYFTKCKSMVTEDSQKVIVQGIKMSQKMLTVVCKEVLPVMTADDFKCAQNTTVLMKMDQCTKTDMTQIRDESEAEMCGRLEKEKMCIKETVAKYCDEKVATDFSNLYVKTMSTMSQQNYDCSGAISGFQINLWISMLMATVLLVFLM